MTYKGFRGYRPMIKVFKEIPLIVYHEIKEGNRHDGHIRAIEKSSDMSLNERQLL